MDFKTYLYDIIIYLNEVVVIKVYKHSVATVVSVCY